MDMNIWTLIFLPSYRGPKSWDNVPSTLFLDVAITLKVYSDYYLCRMLLVFVHHDSWHESCRQLYHAGCNFHVLVEILLLVF